jgi:signal transduction histidine kinase
LQLQNSSYLEERCSKDSPSPSKRIATWFKTINPRLSIRNKICWGYGISLGLAVLGTTVGLTLGDYYQQKARAQLADTQQQGKWLSRLQVTMAEFRPEREFIPVMRDTERFARASTEFAQRAKKVEALLIALQSSPSSNREDMQPFLVAFEGQAENYVQQLNVILQQIDPATIQPNDIPALQRLFVDFVDSPVSLKLFRYSEELTTLIEEAEKQNQLAEVALDRAGVLRTRIIYTSMLLSIALATVLAAYTSYAIARPIKAVTQVAQQVTEAADFSLKVPVSTQDEVGVLAVALNQLIEWTARYTRELQETQTQLIQTEKMSSLGQMVAGVAHEINNPVNFIYGNLTYTQTYTDNLLTLVQLYQQQYPTATPEIETYIEKIDLDFLAEDLPKLVSSMQMGADRIRQLVLSLRNFSRLDEAEMKLIDLHEGIDSTLLLLNHRLKQGIQIVKHYGKLPLVECHPAQINQVFMNIISNAVDALQDCTKTPQITITTESQQDRIVVKIADNGSGISQEIINKLFDPFFTTKPVGQGTGLGLAICYQVVEKHHGKIQITSTPEYGAEFMINLPIKATRNAAQN